MEAPEKIYIHPDIGGREFLRPWLHRPANNESVEYVRKDAFIEKACKWLESLYAPDGSIAPCHVHIIEDFENYMKEE